MTDAIPAATLVIFRDRVSGPPDLLMVERSKAMAFAGGALVFPGGRIDPGDDALAGRRADGFSDAAARIAAIRETIEEAGIAIGVSPSPSATGVASLREALHAGVPFADALTDAGLTLDLARLVPFARWRPAHLHARIFDTFFYLARLPADAPEASADRTETVRTHWAGATAVLEAADAGRATVIYPTRRNLERLAQFGSFADAAADAARFPIRTVTPWTETRGGEQHLCIDDDLGYPVTSEPLRAATRG